MIPIPVSAKWAAVALLMGANLVAQPVVAQKIVERKVWTTFHSTATTPLTGPYKTYSVEYDLDESLPYPLPPPQLGNLAYQPSGGDLTLVVRRKNLALQLGAPERRPQIGGDTHEVFFAVASCDGNIGYDVLESRSKKVLQTYRRSPTSTPTTRFNYVWDLNTYLASAYRHEQEENLLDAIRRRIEYTTADHDWAARITVSQVDGEAAQYRALNQAATELETLLATPTPDKARLRALVAVWEGQLAQVNWDDRKAVINRNVAGALLNNLCAAYLLLQDYAQLREKAALYTNKMSGLLDVVAGDGASPTFEVESGFRGGSTRPAETVELAKGSEVKSYYVVKYSDPLAPAD